MTKFTTLIQVTATQFFQPCMINNMIEFGQVESRTEEGLTEASKIGPLLAQLPEGIDEHIATFVPDTHPDNTSNGSATKTSITNKSMLNLYRDASKAEFEREEREKRANEERDKIINRISKYNFEIEKNRPPLNVTFNRPPILKPIIHHAISYVTSNAGTAGVRKQIEEWDPVKSYGLRDSDSYRTIFNFNGLNTVTDLSTNIETFHLGNRYRTDNTILLNKLYQTFIDLFESDHYTSRNEQLVYTKNGVVWGRACYLPFEINGLQFEFNMINTVIDQEHPYRLTGNEDLFILFRPRSNLTEWGLFKDRLYVIRA